MGKSTAVGPPEPATREEQGRVFWTAEEEGMLHAAHAAWEAHGTSANKWTEIFRYPAFRFHPKRTPHDLKDKWRLIKDHPPTPAPQAQQPPPPRAPDASKKRAVEEEQTAATGAFLL